MLKFTHIAGCTAVALGLVVSMPASAEESCQTQVQQVEKAWNDGGYRRVDGNRQTGIKSQLRIAKEYCQQGKDDEAIHYLEVVRSAMGKPTNHDHKKS